MSKSFLVTTAKPDFHLCPGFSIKTSLAIPTLYRKCWHLEHELNYIYQAAIHPQQVLEPRIQNSRQTKGQSLISD